MSINEEMLEDLANTDTPLEDIEDITPTGPANTGGPDLDIHTTPAGAAPLHQTPLTDEIKQKLLSPSTQLVSIRQGVEEVTSMEQIQEEIADATTIGLSDAKLIMESFKHFGEHFRLNSFTTIPSGINLRETKEFVKRSYKLRKEEVASKYDLFIGGVMTDASEGLKAYEEVYGEELYHSLEELRQRYLDVFEKDKEAINKQSIYLEGHGDANAATSPLSVLTENRKLVDGFSSIQHQYTTFLKAIEGLSTFLKQDSLIGSLIVGINDNKYTPEDIIDAENRVVSYGIDMSPLDFLKALISPRLVTVIDTLNLKAKRAIATLVELDREADIDRNSIKAMSSFVVTNGKVFDDAADLAHYYSEIIDLMRRTIPIANMLLDFYSVEK